LIGVAVSDLRPGGLGRFTDEAGEQRQIDVVSVRGFIQAGAPLVVSEVHGNRVVVRPVETSA
jgi:membrane-bound ClpP family serine protease